MQKGRKQDRARESAIYLARDLSGISRKELGEFFGGISDADITMRYKQFSQKPTGDKNLKGGGAT